MGQFIALIFLAAVCSTHAYNILVISPMPGKSHSILAEGIVRHLANAGHQITYLAGIVPSKSHPNVTIVDVNDSSFEKEADVILNLDSFIKKEQGINVVITTVTKMMEFTEKVLKNPNTQKLLNDESIKIDLVIAEWMFSEIYSSFSAVFDCPYIWFSTVEPHSGILGLIDEYTNPSYNTDIQSSSVPPFSFTQRVMELGFQIFGILLNKFVLGATDINNYDKYIVPIITQRGKPVPSYEELRYNASLVVGNSHLSLGIPTRVPENYKHIGGFHIQETVKPLPEDLKKIMESAKYGVIYFSMGSNIKSKTLPMELKQNLLKLFGSLKQTVLWKFEEDLPNLPKNVHLLKWAPQPSILAHPNLLFFITHGGQLSTTESIHFGVPVIGIPVFADQFVNVNRAVKKGFAKRVDLSLDMVDSLKEAIHEMLTDGRYRAKVKELSMIYHDRTVPPGKELVHWAEHVIKTKGAVHMRSPALSVPWYQKCYLDLVAVLILIYYSIKFAFRLLLNKTRNKQTVKHKLS